MNNIYIISKIIDYNSELLYNFLCINKYFNKNILNNITSLYILKINNNILDSVLKYIPNIRKLNLYFNENITVEGLKYIYLMDIYNFTL